MSPGCKSMQPRLAYACDIDVVSTLRPQKRCEHLFEDKHEQVTEFKGFAHSRHKLECILTVLESR